MTTTAMNPDAPAPPTAPPAPPFVFSRESRIRIDREGDFWHEGERVEHEGLRRGLASWLARDEATGRWILRNALDWCFITVDDTPLVVRAVRLATAPGEPAALLSLSDGTTEPLDPATLWLAPDADVPYCRVKHGAFPARFARSAAFVLLETARPAGADPEAGPFVLELPNTDGPVVLARRAGP